MEDRIITYGGQAVMEGVLMRGQKAMAIAMRSPEGQIVVHTEKLAGIYKSKLATIPFLRGSILLWDALGLGIMDVSIAGDLAMRALTERISGAQWIVMDGQAITQYIPAAPFA